METHMRLWILAACAAALAGSASALAQAAADDGVTVALRDGKAAIENALVRVEYDLSAGTYRAIDVRDGSPAISGAWFQLNDWASNAAGWRHAWTSRPVHDELGAGKALVITCSGEGRPRILLELTVYRGKGCIVAAAGLENTTGETLRLHKMQCLCGGTAFEGCDLKENFSMLDGNGGGQATAVSHGKNLHCRNNLLVTFGPQGANRSLVVGGLTYRDFEKFAAAAESLTRRAALAKRRGGSEPLVCYVDLGEKTADGRAGGPSLSLVQGTPYAWPGAGDHAAAEFGTIAFDDKAVILEASGLDPGKDYRLGFSWWDYDNNGRVQSVSVGAGADGRRRVLFDAKPLPAWRGKKQAPVEGAASLPRDAYRSGRVKIIFSKESDTSNAAVSEAWIRESSGSGAATLRPAAASGAEAPETLSVQLYGEDPVGKRIDPGIRYLPDDRFYVDFTTRNPFEALEMYGRSVRAAQKIHLNVYDFPTVCLWYAEVYGRGQASNDTPGAIAEIDKIAASGFLDYSRAAVRLVPDLYTADNQQGWWDDEHWRRGRSTGERGNGQYAAPYETSAKWAGAVRKRGGIPLTYFQTGFRSEDYAKTFPEHMLFNKSMAPRLDAAGKPRPFSPAMNAWQRNGVLQSYDYTDPGFLRHMRAVYANLRAAGVKGLMFDYPASGWASQGGMEDSGSTTAGAYRNIFSLAYKGLGPDCWIHERALQRGSDISLGLITSQRVWGDTDRISAPMVTRCGLRWYKNRVVVHYDMDAKSLLKARPANRDGVRGLLTMCYVVSGRLLLGNSFGNLTREHWKDLTRIFPYHRTPQSARPVDAFTSRYPRVYDFAVNPQWHQVTFYNAEDKTASIGVKLAGDTAFGALGLEADRSYLVYDFWNDRLVGKLRGSERLVQDVRPGEARMMSIHEVAGRPQCISTNRHVMQGYVDLLDVAWNAERKQLRGRSRVAAHEAYKVVMALNGMQPKGCAAPGARCAIRAASGGGDLAELVLECSESRVVGWSVEFQQPGVRK